MTDLELDVWDAWLRERQEHLEALTMLTTVEDGKRFKIKLEQFRQKLLLSGDYDAAGNYKPTAKKTAV